MTSASHEAHAMTMATAKAPPGNPEVSDIVKPAMVAIVAPLDIDQLADAFKKFEAFKNRLLSQDDSVSIQNKKFLKKSAWRKWALACGVSDRIVSIERVPPTGRDPQTGFYYRVVTEAFHLPTGRSASGVAVASSNEKPRWAHEEHDVLTLAATRSKNRSIADLVGGGEVSAEEMEGGQASTVQAQSNIPAKPAQQSQPTRTPVAKPPQQVPTSSPKPVAQPTTWTDTT